MKYLVIITVFVTAATFAAAGPWLAEELGTTAFEMAMNSSQGATLADYLSVLLLDVLITPFVFVMDLSPQPQFLFFAINGACWACAIWGMWVAWRTLRRRRPHVKE